MIRILSTGAALALLLSTAACTTTATTASVNTAELAADAGAIDFAAQAIEAIPSLATHLTPDQVAQVNEALAQIKTITAQINAASGGAVTVDIGQGWAKQLGAEFQTILTIAGPVVTQFAPGVSGYVTTAEQMIPLIAAAVGLVGNVSAMPGAVGAPAVRARLYQGV